MVTAGLFGIVDDVEPGRDLGGFDEGLFYINGDRRFFSETPTRGELKTKIRNYFRA